MLKGDAPKKLEYTEKEAIITTQDDQQITVPDSTAKVYFQNNKMDNTIINIFNIISEDKERSSIIITQDNKEKVKIEKEEFKHMIKRAIPEVVESSRVWKNISTVDLLLRKPDLLGNSRWGFYLNKNIDVTIEDNTWLNEVHTGKIKNLYAGIRIPVKMEIEVDMDKDNLPIKDSERYSIMEITGDVIEPTKYEQINILDIEN